MNKKEFLHELRARLTGLPEAEIDQRVEFYSEMIDDSIEDGLSEEEAVEKIGNMNGIVKTVASETSLVSIVKEKTKPKRKIRGFEVFLLILGFPLWFPLLMVFLVLCLVFCLLLWILPIVAYTVFTSVLAGSVGGIVIGVMNAINGKVGFGGLYAGAGIAGVGASILIFFIALLCVKITVKLNKVVFTGIKVAIIGRGKKND